MRIIARTTFWSLLFLISPLQAGADRYALVIGVREYPVSDKLPKLPYAEEDAQKLAMVLKDGGYSVTLMSQKASEGEGRKRFSPNAAFLRKEINLLVKTPFLDKDDCILVILAGHGIQLPSNEKEKKARYYFCAADASIDGLKFAEDVKSVHNLISIDDLYKQIEGSKAGVRLLVVDACRNNPNQPSVFRSANTVTRPPIPSPPGGVAALFSCSADQQAVEDPALKHGVFTHYLIEALSGKGDSDKDGELSVSELQQYVGKKTFTFVREKYGRMQLPELQGKIQGWAPLMAVNSTDSKTNLPPLVKTPGKPEMKKPSVDTPSLPSGTLKPLVEYLPEKASLALFVDLSRFEKSTLARSFPTSKRPRKLLEFLLPASQTEFVDQMLLSASPDEKAIEQLDATGPPDSFPMQLLVRFNRPFDSATWADFVRKQTEDEVNFQPTTFQGKPILEAVSPNAGKLILYLPDPRTAILAWSNSPEDTEQLVFSQKFGQGSLAMSLKSAIPESDLLLSYAPNVEPGIWKALMGLMPAPENGGEEDPMMNLLSGLVKVAEKSKAISIQINGSGKQFLSIISTVKTQGDLQPVASSLGEFRTTVLPALEFGVKDLQSSNIPEDQEMAELIQLVIKGLQVRQTDNSVSLSILNSERLQQITQKGILKFIKEVQEEVE